MSPPTIRIAHDPEADVWDVYMSDVQGLSAEAPTAETLIARIPIIIADLRDEDEPVPIRPGLQAAKIRWSDIPFPLLALSRTTATKWKEIRDPAQKVAKRLYASNGAAFRAASRQVLVLDPRSPSADAPVVWERARSGSELIDRESSAVLHLCSTPCRVPCCNAIGQGSSAPAARSAPTPPAPPGSPLRSGGSRSR
ncbi:hypothetical protein DK412_28120 [Methylobacterium sp. 17Sr1-1]|nr:hypothetical protein DK412_28120 [Methylobacterium sp. 17Sr1-1]